MATVRVSSKGWVVIPARLRRKYNIKPGTRIDVVDHEGELGLVPAGDDPVARAYGMLKGGPSLTRALLKERAEELKREERKIKRVGAR